MFKITEFVSNHFLFNFKYLEIPVSEQLEYLDSLGIPKDDVERSFLQYKCQTYYTKWYYLMALNIVGYLYILIFPILYLLSKRPTCSCQYNALEEAKDWKNNCLPESVKKRYPNRVAIGFEGGCYLDGKDFKYIYNLLKRKPFYGYFLMKCIQKIAKYKYLILCYKPSAILVHGEYSFTSSILTNYCANSNIKHIDYQHGERMLQITCSFFHFDECYVWEKHYKDIYKRLKVSSEIIIERPLSILMNIESHKNSQLYADCKYYLAGESEEQMVVIRENMKRIGKLGMTWKVRPHHNYTNTQLLHRLFKEDEIENNSIPIEDSISNLKHPISLYSTVLYQAASNGLIPIIDDLTNIKRYNQLLDLNYIIISKQHIKLSVFLSK
jgi:hypothetical protein